VSCPAIPYVCLQVNAQREIFVGGDVLELGRGTVNID
jgi:hypothetical protein